MAELIAAGIVFWLFIGIGGVMNIGDEVSTGANWAIFFWPVTLPIFLVTGCLTGIVFSVVYGVKMVAGKV